MKKAYVSIVTAVILSTALSTAMAAENWVILGLLTKQIKGQEATVELVQIGGFDSKQKCDFVVKSEAFSKEHIGANNGTSGKLPAVHWNFDGDCWLKRSD